MTRESNFYPPERTRDFLMDAKLPDARCRSLSDERTSHAQDLATTAHNACSNPCCCRCRCQSARQAACGVCAIAICQSSKSELLRPSGRSSTCATASTWLATWRSSCTLTTCCATLRATCRRCFPATSRQKAIALAPGLGREPVVLFLPAEDFLPGPVLDAVILARRQVSCRGRPMGWALRWVLKRPSASSMFESFLFFQSFLMFSVLMLYDTT